MFNIANNFVYSVNNNEINCGGYNIKSLIPHVKNINDGGYIDSGIPVGLLFLDSLNPLNRMLGGKKKKKKTLNNHEESFGGIIDNQTYDRLVSAAAYKEPDPEHDDHHEELQHYDQEEDQEPPAPSAAPPAPPAPPAAPVQHRNKKTKKRINNNIKKHKKTHRNMDK